MVAPVAPRSPYHPGVTATARGTSDPFFRRVLIGLAAGVAVGLFLGEAIAPLDLVGTVFIKLLQVTVLPYVVGSIIVGIGASSADDAAMLARRGGLLLAVVWGLMLVWVGASTFAYPASTGSVLVAADTAAPAAGDWLDVYVPANVFKALANNFMPAVVVFSLLVGVAITGMAEASKAPLLAVLAAFNDAMGRVSSAIVRFTPLGLFAMAGVAAGTLRGDELVRVQAWFVVYIGSSLVVALWLLPSLVAIVTPVERAAFVRQLRTALVTAFAAGDYFVVLPMITAANRTLLQERGVAPPVVEGTAAVAVPLLYNFPDAGKVLSLAFFPFAAWYVGSELAPGQWMTLTAAGVPSVFGSINAGVIFLLDQLRLPADLFPLFNVSGVVNARFNALVAVVHTAGLSLVLAAMAGGVFRLRPRVLLRTGVTALCVVALLFAGTRAWLAVMIPPAPTGLAALDGVTLRDGQPAAVVVPQEPAAEALPPAGRLARLQARGSLRIGVFADGVPFTFTNVAGALVGYDVEMGQALARALGVRAEFVVVDRDRLPEMLDRGVCDIVMSGLVVTVASSTAIAFSTPYHEGPLAFLVPDHRRAQFTSLTGLQASALPLGTPSERLAPPVRRLLPRAIVKEAPLPSLLASGRLDGVEAMVLPLAQAVYASRMQPALAAVVPDDSTYRTVAAYGLPMGADSLREAVNAWIEVARGGGQFASAEDYWIRGRAQAVRAPRWSLGHSVFGWW